MCLQLIKDYFAQNYLLHSQLNLFEYPYWLEFQIDYLKQFYCLPQSNIILPFFEKLSALNSIIEESSLNEEETLSCIPHLFIFWRYLRSMKINLESILLSPVS